MIAYLRGEPGADEVESRLQDDSEPCLAHAINLCEVYYKAMRRSGNDAAESAIQDLKGQGLIVRDDLDELFWREVGRHKAAIGSIPLADCFVVALTTRFVGAELVTADRPDFEPVEEQGICRVTFIR